MMVLPVLSACVQLPTWSANGASVAFASHAYDTGSRTKRSRKKVRLYNPQDDPAREWQSDERKGWNEDSDSWASTSSDSESEASSSTRKRPPCLCCQDDPKIPVCVFCACRVCFLKRHRSKLARCEECDEIYHTYCLDPPLKNVPAKKSWNCPPCRKAQRRTSSSSTDTTRTTSRKSTTPEKRGPGRPRKYPPGTTPTSTPSPTGRKRGRPPKLEQQQQLSPSSKRERVEPEPEESLEEVITSRSGRTVKSIVKPQVTETASVPTPASSPPPVQPVVASEPKKPNIVVGAPSSVVDKSAPTTNDNGFE